VLVHHTSKLASNATASAGTRVITTSKLGHLHAATRAAATALADAEPGTTRPLSAPSSPATGSPADR